MRNWLRELVAWLIGIKEPLDKRDRVTFNLGKKDRENHPTP